MPLIQRQELKAKIDTYLTEDGPRLFLFFGERFLCRKAADAIQASLVERRQGIIYPIDGDQEDGSQTLSKLMSFSLLPGLQIYRVNDTRLFLSKNMGLSIWQKAVQSHTSGKHKKAAKHIADMYHLASIPVAEREPLSHMTEEQWQQNFGTARPADLAWTDPIFETMEKQKAQPSPVSDLPEMYIQSFDRGIPHNNMLLLTTENVDKRKRLFQYIKEHGVVVDCSVAEGAGSAAQKVQKSILLELMNNTLNQHRKRIDVGALDILFERVGFHPIAVVMETEKLALYCDEKSNITLDDVKKMVGRSREDALFELTDHFGKRKLAKTLLTLHHLLEAKIHGLAILATLRNYIRKLLVFRTLQLKPEPAYHRGLSPKQFQENYLPLLKEQGEWVEMLKGHPYALFMSFSKAAEFTTASLKGWLEQLLDAEFKMKGAGLPEQLILESLIINMMLQPITT